MIKPMRLSYSQINTWDLCPRSYEYRYIKKIPIIKGGRMIAGSVYHRAVCYALGSKANGFDVSEEEIYDVITNAWDAEVGSSIVKEGEDAVLEAKKIDWGDDVPDKLKDRVIALTMLYLKDKLPLLQPLRVEKKHSIEISPELSLMGYIDVEFSDGNIADHKFSKKRMNQNEVDNSMQASAYATILDRPLTCAFHQALDQKKLDIDIITTNRTIEDIEWYIKKVIQTSELIKTGIFPPNTTSWKCSPDYCDYYADCRIF